MKKGYTIIEVIIVLGFAGVIATLMVSLMLTYSSSYIESSKKHLDYSYSMEALFFIQNSVKDVGKVKNVSVDDNIININYVDETIKKQIKLKANGNLVIVDLKNNVVTASNNVITGISYFQAHQKNNLIYVTLTRKNGETYEKCISINTET
jgi:type II secretory pathway pseudopilin PulG